jgi:hypothetical protein
VKRTGGVKIRLEYGDVATLANSLVDRSRRLLFYPAIGRLQLGEMYDADVAVSQLRLQVPVRVLVVGRRTLPQGSRLPRGSYLEVVPEDAARFERLCQVADGSWLPQSGRSHPRVRANLMARYYVPPRFFMGETIDISPDGLFLRVNGPLLEVGKGVLVRLRPSLLAPRIELEARVCWLDTVESRKGMGLYCFGPPRELEKLMELTNKFLARASLPVDLVSQPPGADDFGEVK